MGPQGRLAGIGYLGRRRRQGPGFPKPLGVLGKRRQRTSPGADRGPQTVRLCPEALAGLKRILASACDLPLAEALRYEQSVFQSVVVTESAREAMQSAQSRYDREQG